MRKGVLFFAFNNDTIDYVALASAAAKRVKRILGPEIEVAIVTDSNRMIGYCDQVIQQERMPGSARTFRDAGRPVSDMFFNANRLNAYALSPFDETIILDVDYIIQTRRLNNLWGQKSELMIGLDAVRVDGKPLPIQERRLSEVGPRMYWATATYFKKCELSRMFFDLVGHVSDNWDYYTTIYDLPSAIFRNDFAFSIAAHILNGHGQANLVKPLPFKLVTATERESIVSMEDGVSFVFSDSTEPWKNQMIKIRTDVHCMNKYSLAEQVKR